MNSGATLKFKCSGINYDLKVEDKDTIESIKKRLESLHDISADQSVFIISGEELTDNMTVSEVLPKLKPEEHIWIYLPILKSEKPVFSGSPTKWRPEDKGMTPTQYINDCLGEK